MRLCLKVSKIPAITTIDLDSFVQTIHKFNLASTTVVVMQEVLTARNSSGNIHQADLNDPLTRMARGTPAP